VSSVSGTYRLASAISHLFAPMIPGLLSLREKSSRFHSMADWRHGRSCQPFFFSSVHQKLFYILKCSSFKPVSIKFDLMKNYIERVWFVCIRLDQVRVIQCMRDWMPGSAFKPGPRDANIGSLPARLNDMRNFFSFLQRSGSLIRCKSMHMLNCMPCETNGDYVQVTKQSL
jgi:hypothetical protein